MSITKSEAIVMLAMSTGNADGEFSDNEVSDALTKNPVFREVFIEAQSTDWAAKVRTGELTPDSAIKALNHLSADDKIEAMAICWGVMLSDGVMMDGERELIDKWILKLSIKTENVIEKHLKQNSTE